MPQSKAAQAPAQSDHELLLPPRVQVHASKDDGIIPNNSKLPLLIYKQALLLPREAPADAIEELLQRNHWGGTWRNSIYTYHHYHSTAHEVLLVYQGSAKVQLGGEKGITSTIHRGDVIIIPAGVAHKNLGASEDFAIVGAYPCGQDWNMCYGKASERPKADEEIAKVGLPKADPVYGIAGPLMANWK